MSEEDDIEDEERDPVKQVAMLSTVPSVLHQLGQRQQSVANMLVSDDHLQNLTHFWTKAEPKQYAKMVYLLRAVEAVDGVDGESNGTGYKFPAFQDLIDADIRFREAYQKGRAKDLVSITKVLERTQEPERGGFMG